MIAQALPVDDPQPPRTITLPSGKEDHAAHGDDPADVRTAHRAARRRRHAAAGRRNDAHCAEPAGLPAGLRPALRRRRTRTLEDKPSCQHEYAYKMGLALGAKAGYNIVGTLQSAAEAQGQADARSQNGGRARRGARPADVPAVPAHRRSRGQLPAVPAVLCLAAYRGRRAYRGGAEGRWRIPARPTTPS
ncbi:MAG: hypothetical protein WDM81_03225 [Rhizomicrobium sp.]